MNRIHNSPTVGRDKVPLRASVGTLALPCRAWSMWYLQAALRVPAHPPLPAPPPRYPSSIAYLHPPFSPRQTKRALFGEPRKARRRRETQPVDCAIAGARHQLKAGVDNVPHWLQSPLPMTRYPRSHPRHSQTLVPSSFFEISPPNLPPYLYMAVLALPWGPKCTQTSLCSMTLSRVGSPP